MLQVHKNEGVSTEIPSEVKALLSDDISYLVIQDGEIISKHLSDGFEGLQITSIFDLTEQEEVYYNSESVQSHMSDSTTYNFEEANSGLFIKAPRNKIFEDTLHVFYVQDKFECNNNVMIVCEDNSALTYFEYIISYGSTSVNHTSNAFALENAQLTYSGMSKLNEKTMASITRNAYVKRYGKVEYSIAEVNDATTDSKTNILLQEQYATGTTKTVAITNHGQDAKFTQLVEHQAKETEGYIENYGVANGQSTLVFEGIGKILKDMKRSVARQSNRGIVLGNKSRLDANPLLLIDEFDVVASHGAAIGKMDEEQLYYLMSRGLTLKNAERLIISGFLSPVLEKLTTDGLKEEFIVTVEEKTL